MTRRPQAGPLAPEEGPCPQLSNRFVARVASQRTLLPALYGKIDFDRMTRG